MGAIRGTGAGGGAGLARQPKPRLLASWELPVHPERPRRATRKSPRSPYNEPQQRPGYGRVRQSSAVARPHSGGSDRPAPPHLVPAQVLPTSPPRHAAKIGSPVAPAPPLPPPPPPPMSVSLLSGIDCSGPLPAAPSVLDEELARSRKQLAARDGDVAALKRDAAEADGQRRVADERTRVVELRLQEAAVELRHLRAERERLEAAQRVLQDEKRQLAVTASHAESLALEVRQLREERDAVQASLSAEVGQMRSDLEAARSQVAELTQRLRASEGSRDMLQTALKREEDLRRVSAAAAWHAVRPVRGGGAAAVRQAAQGWPAADEAETARRAAALSARTSPARDRSTSPRAGGQQPLPTDEVVLTADQSAVLRTRVDIWDPSGGRARRAGEQWLLRGPISYAPPPGVEVVMVHSSSRISAAPLAARGSPDRHPADGRSRSASPLPMATVFPPPRSGGQDAVWQTGAKQPLDASLSFPREHTKPMT
eukprot:TRINITY_DN1092_c0_g1_i1.p1 TRINITY_DN1092_c0_g1~~TRINITY_DN1092_c0_g1_i1.p1  ORF type:complete len:501 (+),score=146.71 TRINITY_DN1092_c0_g1_i1:54-1505(+)